MYQVIVCPLHERGVDIAERDHSFFRQSGGESHRVTFGYPDIEGPLRECLHHIDHGTSGRHGGSDTHDPLILFRPFHQRMSENVLIQLRLIQVVHDDALACFLVELARCMPFGSRFLGRLEPFSFLCLDMQQLGALQIFYIVQ